MGKYIEDFSTRHTYSIYKGLEVTQGYNSEELHLQFL